MDKNSIKKYAVWARNELISRVAQKANQYGITEAETISASADSIYGKLLTPTEKKQRSALIEKIKNKGKNGFQLVMEEVAYTWFNRFTAIRFMEVNGYLPSHVRVFTDDENRFVPQILAEAIHLDMPGLDMEKVFELKQANKTEELYKYLIITQCNALNEILPGMFQKIEDYTELLLPDNLLREGSVIEQMITLIPEEDWTDQVQIIGWLYQYYNSEPKDLVFANLKKNIKITKENIPAATQLFTPDWIVRYMVENSLGRIWLDGHPNNELKAGWSYYIDDAEQEEQVIKSLAKLRQEYSSLKPEEIKVIDPCMGSGHILSYMFDLLVQIYETYGYSARDAASFIVEKNLYGLDIDDRAAQLAYFAVMMKARQYDRRFFNRCVKPNVFPIIESNNISQDAIEAFANGNEKVKDNLLELISSTIDAKEFGSLIKVDKIDFSLLKQQADVMKEQITLFSNEIINYIIPLINATALLGQKYSVVITNPPYMGSSGMNAKLSEYTKKYYPKSKLDLFACFIERCQQMTDTNGYCAMITQQAFMFLGSYEKLRQSIYSSATITNMLHFGYGTFGADFGTTSFVLHKGNIKNYLAKYIRLAEYRNVDDKHEALRTAIQDSTSDLLYISSQERHKDIPGENVVYWITDRFLSILKSAPRLDEIATIRVGMHTGNNDIFVREWYEVNSSNITFDCSSHENSKHIAKKWFPYNKGGGNRRWYGYRNKIVNWRYGGQDIHKFHSLPMDYNGAPVRAKDLQFREGVTWSDTGSTGIFASRYSPLGAMFDVKGSSGFMNKKYLYYVIGFLNVKIATHILNMFNPTITYQVGNISSLPLLFDETNSARVNELVESCIELSRSDYNSDETSWEFDSHPLVKYSRNLWDATAIAATMSKYYKNQPPFNSPLELCYLLWKGECETRFNELKQNEEELNRLFIDIYGLEDELSPEVNDKDISVRKSDLSRDIKSFISYAVGCMFGRYSLDVDGVAYAGGEWNSNKYIAFQADKDNVLPICDDEYFEDDIVGKFVKFVEMVYGEDTLEENLKFIADALGGNGSPRDVIRSYFLNDFYADHLKVYQKTPIYWQFDSGKKNGFKCLIYMHRYQPDTIARIRTDYVHEQQARYRTAIADLEQRIQVANTSERVKLTKLLQKLMDQETEIRLFEEKIHHLADQMIRIDLDDGVKHNYEIFKDLLTKIK